MGQRIILYSKLPSSDYLDDLVATGVLRAAMTFLPGSRCAGAGIFPETTTFALSTSLDGGTTATSGCPYPEDPVACRMWEIQEIWRKTSFGVPQAFNAFVFLRLRQGYGDTWAEHVMTVARSAEAELGAEHPDYFAAGHLVGCGDYNAVFELLTSDHQRLLRTIRRLTDLEYVEDTMVGFVAADGARGFGEPALSASLARP